MDRTNGRRLCAAAAVTLVATFVSAAPAAAQRRCAVPKDAGWHSCLTAAHRADEAGNGVRLRRAVPRLVIRYEHGCPGRVERRAVVIRTDDGDRVGRKRGRARCRNGVVRFRYTLKLDRLLPEGTVVRSNWSRIPDDGRAAPGVRLKG